MYILSVLVREFGGLRDLSLDLSEGLNLITGGNESGKSTLIAFIRFILYGLPKRRAGEALSDGERAYSWENSVADGSMTVKKDGAVYRIERREQSASARKLLQIIDEETGEPLPKGIVPGEYFLGIPASVFDSTACIRQLRSRELDRDGLTGAIENLLLSGDESINTEKALKNLDKARTALLHKNGHGGEIHKIDGEITSLTLKLDRLRADIADLRQAEEEEGLLKGRITDAERALKAAEEDCTRTRHADILAQFDALHDEENRLEKERNACERLTEMQTYNGFLPDAAFVRSLDESAQRLDADERSILRCDAELRIAREAPEMREDALLTAKRVREAGGKTAVLNRIDRETRMLERTNRRAKILLALGGMLLLPGILLAIITGNPVFTLFSLGGVLLLPAFLAKKRHRSAKRAYFDFLISLGLDPTLDIPAYLTRLEEDSERERARRQRIEDAEKLLKEAKASASLHLNAAKENASRVLPYGTAVTASSLRALASRLSRESAERDRAAHSLSLYEENCRRMREALAPYDERELRSRLPVGFDYKNASEKERYREKRDRLRETLSRLSEERLALERRLSALRATVGSPDELLALLDLKRSEKESLEEKHRAILLAYSSIAAARDSLKHRIGPRLRADASRYLSVLSGGRYDSLSYDQEFELSTEAAGIVRPSSAFSGGTQDAMYLSLRLALTGLLREDGEPLPILLDEALAQLDDGRAEALLSILLSRADEEKGQAIFFTCHTRESRMLAGTSARLITL